jgi:hypothetical protein
MLASVGDFRRALWTVLPSGSCRPAAPADDNLTPNAETQNRRTRLQPGKATEGQLSALGLRLSAKRETPNAEAQRRREQQANTQHRISSRMVVILRLGRVVGVPNKP